MSQSLDDQRTGSVPNTGQRPFLHEIHGLRGIAILCVVMVHVFGALIGYLGIDQDLGAGVRGLRIAIEIAFHGSTVYFAAISGVLFSAVLVRRGWWRFYRSKFLYVAVPYTLMTLLFTWVRYSPIPQESGFVVHTGGGAAYLHDATRHLLAGSAQQVYWYIPVLLCLYLLTPALLAAARSKLAVAVIAAVPLVVSRTGVEVTLPSVAYFAGGYGVGVYIGADYERRLRWLTGRLPGLVALSLLATLCLGAVFAGSIDRVGAVSLRETCFYLQKLGLTGVLLVVLSRRWPRPPAVIERAATYAFAIYFLHLFVLYLLLGAVLPLLRSPSTPTVLLVGLVLFVVTTGLCLVLAATFRRIFGPHARWLVGA